MDRRVRSCAAFVNSTCLGIAAQSLTGQLTDRCVRRSAEKIGEVGSVACRVRRSSADVVDDLPFTRQQWLQIGGVEHPLNTAY